MKGPIRNGASAPKPGGRPGIYLSFVPEICNAPRKLERPANSRGQFPVPRPISLRSDGDTAPMSNHRPVRTTRTTTLGSLIALSDPDHQRDKHNALEYDFRNGGRGRQFFGDPTRRGIYDPSNQTG